MKYSILIVTTLCLLVSCSKIQKVSIDNASKNNAVEITRLDKLQAELIINNSTATVQDMVINCPEETKILIEDVLRVGNVNDPNIEAKISDYFTKNTMRLQLVKDVETKYHNLDKLAEDLKTSFDKLHDEVPSIPMPHFYTQISGFNQSIVVGDSIIGISLDKYMGEDYPPYQKLYFAQQIEQMKASRIVEDCLHFWIESKVLKVSAEQPSLLDVMLYVGKINWIVTKLVAKDRKKDSRFYYIKSDKLIQDEWASMSKSLLSKKFLSSKDKNMISYIMFGTPQHEATVVKGLNAVGIPAGIRIIDDYMQRHPQCTIRQLLKNRQASNILHDAGYKEI